MSNADLWGGLCKTMKGSVMSNAARVLSLLAFWGLVWLVPGVGACAAAAEGGATPAWEMPDAIPMILIPHEEAVLSAAVSSQVLRIHKRIGESFQEGDPLIEFDRTVHEANRTKARAQLTSALTQLKSKESLFTDGTVSAAELAEARMNVEVARAHLVVAERDLGQCVIHAPYTGRVVRELVNRFELVQHGQPVMEIVADHVLKAQFLLPSEGLTRIALGQKVEVAVHETGTVVPGRVCAIGAVIDPGSGTVRVFADVENARQFLRVGMRGRVHLTPAVDDQGDASAPSTPTLQSPPEPSGEPVPARPVAPPSGTSMYASPSQSPLAMSLPDRSPAGQSRFNSIPPGFHGKGNAREQPRVRACVLIGCAGGGLPQDPLAEWNPRCLM